MKKYLILAAIILAVAAEHTYHLPEHTELDETGFESEPEGAS